MACCMQHATRNTGYLARGTQTHSTRWYCKTLWHTARTLLAHARLKYESHAARSTQHAARSTQHKSHSSQHKHIAPWDKPSSAVARLATARQESLPPPPAHHSHSHTQLPAPCGRLDKCLRRNSIRLRHTYARLELKHYHEHMRHVGRQGSERTRS